MRKKNKILASALVKTGINREKLNEIEKKYIPIPFLDNDSPVSRVSVNYAFFCLLLH